MPSDPDYCPRLSVAIIVRNAGEALTETIESVREIADEIVVCDTGSTDDTVQIARRLATTVVERPWDDDFSAARNECLANVHGDWVLWLDAGEWLEEPDAAGLRELLNSNPEPRQAHMMLVKLPPEADHGAAEQIGRIRLVPNDPSIRFTGRVRETMMASLEKAGVTLKGLPYSILRGVRELEAPVKVRKARRDLHLADLETKEHGPSAGLLNCQAEAFAALGDYSQASTYFRQAIQISQRGSTEMLEAYYGLLTSLDGTADAQASQLSICLEALGIFQLDTQLLCAMGGYLQNLDRMDLAMRSYETAYRYGQVNPETWHLQDLADVAAMCYAASLQLKERSDEALVVLQEALTRNESSVRLRRQLIDVCVKQGNQQEALTHVAKLPEGTPHIEALRSAVRGACLAVQQNWIAARAYLDAAYSAGCRDLVCLRWLSVTLLAIGDFPKARPVLNEWRNLDPTNAEAGKYLDAIDSAEKEAAAAEASGSEEVPASQTDGENQTHLRIDDASPAPGSEVPQPNLGSNATASEYGK